MDVVDIILETPTWMKILFFPLPLVMGWKVTQLTWDTVSFLTGEDMPNYLLQDKNKKNQMGSIPEIALLKSTPSVIEGFRKLGSYRCLRAATSLEEEYNSVASLISNADASMTVLNLKRMREIVDSLYTQGTGFLSKALSIGQLIGEDTTDKLKTELDELGTEQSKLLESSLAYALVKERIEKNKAAYTKIKGYTESVNELLSQAGLCRDSIRDIRFSLPSLIGNQPQDELDKTILEVKTRLEFAQKVADEYKKQGI